MTINDPTSKEAARELCRRLGIDPERFWGVVNDFACDCYFAGQQEERGIFTGGCAEGEHLVSSDGTCVNCGASCP